MDCSDNEFRTIETSLDQILHRTTANEPLIIVQQARGQQGFKAWYAIVRRYGQKNMSDNNSTYAGSISKISERDRAEDVEQFDDVLSTCINERNNFDNRCCITRDEEKMLAVKKLMLESQLLENIIDNVATVPTVRNRKIDKSAPMDIGLAAQGDGEHLREERKQRIVDLTLQVVYQGTGKGHLKFGKVQSWNEIGYQGGEGGKDANQGGKNSWQKGSGTKGSKGQEKGGKGGNRACWTCGKTGHIAAWCRQRGNKKLYAVDEDESEHIVETLIDDDELHPWVFVGRK